MEATDWSPRIYIGTVYRNIPTCYPRQNLYDDLTDEAEKLDRLVQATSGIDHSGHLEMHRPLQYGTLDDDLLRVFKRENWRTGRFGDGRTYGVWYSAEEEETSLYETCYWSYRIAKDNILNHDEIYSADRTMYRAALDAKLSIDLTAWTQDFTELVHPRNYSFCQRLGSRVSSEGVEMLRSPSARRVGGICTPVFQSMVIKEASAINTIHIYVRPDGSITAQAREGGGSLVLRAADLENPHSVA